MLGMMYVKLWWCSPWASKVASFLVDEGGIEAAIEGSHASYSFSSKDEFSFDVCEDYSFRLNWFFLEVSILDISLI